MKKYFIPLVSATVINVAVAQSDVSTFFQQLQTFNANFSQVVEQDGKVVQRSTGKVWLKKPLKFRWNYQTPDPMQLVSDGRRFYHYDIDLAQVTTKPLSEITNTASMTLLSDKKRLDQVFNIQSFSAPAVKKRFPRYAKQWLKKAILFYQLTPKNKNVKDGQPSLLVLGLTAKRRLNVFYAEDNYGKNNFIFSNVQQGGAIADAQFNFKAPAGVDVLGQ